MNRRNLLNYLKTKLILALFIICANALLFLYGCSSMYKETYAGNEEENGEPVKNASVDYIYGIPMDDKAGVIKETAADVYTRPDVKSERITQALYNQPVSILQEENGWAKVKVVDGATGWMKLKHIERSVSSIYGRTFTHKILVTSKEKSVYSSPSGGITVAIVPMGAELYAFNSSGADTYEVFLPGNKTGWVMGSGIIHIGLGEKTPVTNAEDFAATAKRFKGVAYLQNGRSFLGIDAHGLIYICARINGIDLPCSLEGQLNTGTEIKPEDASTGDLVFLSEDGEEEKGKISCVGICTGDGNYIYAGRRTGYVAVGDMKKANADGKVVAARRIFN